MEAIFPSFKYKVSFNKSLKSPRYVPDERTIINPIKDTVIISGVAE